jgi:hypothetical protein
MRTRQAVRKSTAVSGRGDNDDDDDEDNSDVDVDVSSGEEQGDGGREEEGVDNDGDEVRASVQRPFAAHHTCTCGWLAWVFSERTAAIAHSAINNQAAITGDVRYHGHQPTHLHCPTTCFGSHHAPLLAHIGHAQGGPAADFDNNDNDDAAGSTDDPADEVSGDDNNKNSDDDDNDNDNDDDDDDEGDADSADDPLDDSDEDDGDDPNDDEEEKEEENQDDMPTSVVPAFALRGGDPIDQALHAVTKEAAWFNEYFTASLIAQFGIDPSALFPALSAHGRGHHHDDTTAGVAGSASIGADVFGNSSNNVTAGHENATCDPAAGAVATITASVVGLPWAVLVFAALLSAAQRRLYDPTAPRNLLRGALVDTAIALVMGVCVHHAHDGPVQRILLVYLFINTLTAVLRTAVFASADRDTRNCKRPVQVHISSLTFHTACSDV